MSNSIAGASVMTGMEQIQASAKVLFRQLEDIMLSAQNNHRDVSNNHDHANNNNNYEGPDRTIGRIDNTESIGSTLEHYFRTIFQSCSGRGGMSSEQNIVTPVTSYTSNTSLTLNDDDDDNQSKALSISVYSTTTTSTMPPRRRRLEKQQSKSPEIRQHRQQKSPTRHGKLLSPMTPSSRVPPPPPPSLPTRYGGADFGEHIYEQLFYADDDNPARQQRIPADSRELDSSSKDPFVQSFAKKQSSDTKNTTRSQLAMKSSFFPKSSPNRNCRPNPIYPKSPQRPSPVLIDEELNIPIISANLTFDDGISALSANTLEMMASELSQQNQQSCTTDKHALSEVAIPNVVIPSNRAQTPQSNITATKTTVTTMTKTATTTAETMPSSSTSSSSSKLTPCQFQNQPPTVTKNLPSTSPRLLSVSPVKKRSNYNKNVLIGGLSPIIPRVQSTLTWNSGRHSTPSKASKNSRSTQTTQSSTKSFENWQLFENQYWAQQHIQEQCKTTSPSTTTKSSTPLNKTPISMEQRHTNINGRIQHTYFPSASSPSGSAAYWIVADDQVQLGFEQAFTSGNPFDMAEI